MKLLVPMIHPRRGERLVHPKAAPKYERNGWRRKTPAKRRPRQADPAEAPENTSGAFTRPETASQEGE